MSSKICLITGATSGIGYATAKLLASKNYKLILTGRRNDRLENLSREIEKKYNSQVLTLCFDVRDREETIAKLSNLPEEWNRIDVLINNAGLALGLSNLDEGDFSDWDQMIDTNLKGLLNVTYVVVQKMKENKSGHIINVGSIAGKEVYPKGNVYCATKHAVDALSKALRMELVEYGIKVTQVCPGATETEFSLVRFKGDVEKAKEVYKGFTPLTADDVAEIILFCIERSPHVCINDILITPTAQANVFITHRNK